MSQHKIQLRSGQVELIERLAVDQEKGGLQPAPAKVFALLMVSDATQLTFDEIRETLGISKSATSQAINQLLMINRIEYTTHIGDRRRYFKARITNLKEDVSTISNNIFATSAIYEAILQQRPDSEQDRNEGIRLMIHFMNFIARELPLLVEKFQQEEH